MWISEIRGVFELLITGFRWPELFLGFLRFREQLQNFLYKSAQAMRFVFLGG